MGKRNIGDYLDKTNEQLLSEFKWGSDGEDKFFNFIKLVREQNQKEKEDFDKIENINPRLKKYLDKTDKKLFKEFENTKDSKIQRKLEFLKFMRLTREQLNYNIPDKITFNDFEREFQRKNKNL